MKRKVNLVRHAIQLPARVRRQRDGQLHVTQLSSGVERLQKREIMYDRRDTIKYHVVLHDF